MTDLHIGLAVIGGLVLLGGIFSTWIKDRSILSVPLLALILGAVLGPTGFDVFDPRQWPRWERIVEETARVTLAIGLMGVALRLPSAYLRRHWRPLVVVLAVVMTLMWLISSLLAYWLLDLSLLFALLIGAILTPTDPVVASSIVTSNLAKEAVPERLRHLLSAESGINDGLAYLFVLLPILLLEHTPQAAWQHWFTVTLLREVVGGVLIGVVIGFVAGRLLEWVESREDVERSGFLSVTIALSLLTVGVARLLDTNGVLAVFVAGIAFDNQVSGEERAREANVQELVNQFFALPIFVLIGLILPIQEWIALGWRGVALVVAILLLRRLPAMLLLQRWIAPLQRRPDALFLGWFGPIGVSALFYAMLALHRTGDEITWAAASLVIAASVFVHGVTGTPFTKWYQRTVASSSQ